MIPLPTDRAAIILNLLFGEPYAPAIPDPWHPPAPRAELVEALAQIHQHPAHIVEEACL